MAAEHTAAQVVALGVMVGVAQGNHGPARHRHREAGMVQGFQHGGGDGVPAQDLRSVIGTQKRSR